MGSSSSGGCCSPDTREDPLPERDTSPQDQRPSIGGKPLTGEFVHARFLEVFDRFDTNGDGVFQQEELVELAKVFAHIGGQVSPQSPAALEKGVGHLLELFDTNKDGMIERDEFASELLRALGYASLEEFSSPITEGEFVSSVSARFPLLFTDRSGAPLTWEFVREQYAKAFDRFDDNNDGVFQQAELERFAEAFAKLGGAHSLDAAAIATAAEDTRRVFDLNGDGVVTRDEFADQYMQMTGFTSRENFRSPVTEDQFLASIRFSCPVLFGTGAPDSPGAATFNTFKTPTGAAPELSQEDTARIQRLWEAIDTDASGKLERGEILAWQWGNEEDCAKFIVEVDINKDGEISKTEFVAYWQAKKNELSALAFDGVICQAEAMATAAVHVNSKE